MPYEIERIPKMRQPDPIETLQGIATMQVFTIGLLIALNLRLGRKLRKMNIKEVVVVVKKEE